MTPVETPGHVLREFREIETRRNQRNFGMLVAEWGENVQRRLEDGSTRFTREHLNILLERSGLKRGSRWHQRFEAAMVGDEWPAVSGVSVVHDEEKDEYTLEITDAVVLPKEAAGKTLRIVARAIVLVLVLFMCGGGYLLLTSPYMPFYWQADHQVANGPIVNKGLGGGAGELECKQTVGLYPDDNAPDPLPIGSLLAFDTEGGQDCYWRFRLCVDGALIGWSNAYPSVNPGKVSAGFYWDTTGYSPGEHVVSAEFVPYLWHLSARTTKEVAIILIASNAGEQPYSSKTLIDDRIGAETISKLRHSCPVDAATFSVDYDYGIDMFVVAFKNGRDMPAWQQWVDANDYGVISEKFWQFETQVTLAETAVVLRHEAELMDRFDKLLPLETEAYRIYMVEGRRPRYDVKIKEKLQPDEGEERFYQWLNEEGFGDIRSRNFSIHNTLNIWTVEEATTNLRSSCPINEWGDFTIIFDETNEEFVVTFESNKDLDYWRQWMDLYDYRVLVDQDIFVFEP